MIVSSVINLKGSMTKELEQFIGEIAELEIHSIDKGRVLVTVDCSSDKELTAITKSVNAHPDVVEISHHSFYFDEDER